MQILVRTSAKPYNRPHEIDCGTVIVDLQSENGVAIAVGDSGNGATRYALYQAANGPMLRRLHGLPSERILLLSDPDGIRVVYGDRVEKPTTRTKAVGQLALGEEGFFAVVGGNGYALPVHLHLAHWQIRDEDINPSHFDWFAQWSLVCADGHGSIAKIVDRNHSS